MGLVETERPAAAAKRPRPNVAAKKRRFLRAIGEGHFVTGAAKIAGRNARTFYRWRDEDPEFAAKWREAERLRCEAVAQEVSKRALAGSDTLLIFLMKRLDPSFRDAHQVQVEHTGTVQHEHKVVSASAVFHVLQDSGAFDGFEDPELGQAGPERALPGSRQLLAAQPDGEAGGVPPAPAS